MRIQRIPLKSLPSAVDLFLILQIRRFKNLWFTRTVSSTKSTLPKWRILALVHQARDFERLRPTLET